MLCDYDHQEFADCTIRAMSTTLSGKTDGGVSAKAGGAIGPLRSLRCGNRHHGSSAVHVVATHNGPSDVWNGFIVCNRERGGDGGSPGVVIHLYHSSSLPVGAHLRERSRIASRRYMRSRASCQCSLVSGLFD